jgi:hypothetical protein
MSEVITNATENKEEKVEIKKFRFENDNPVKFPESIKLAHLRTDEITSMINDIFRDVFPDYWGCNLTNDPLNYVPQVTLAFRHRDDISADSIQATCNLTEETKKDGHNSIIAGINFLSNTQFNQKIYDLSKAGKELLEDFMIPESKSNFTISNNTLIANTTKSNTSNNNSKINWDNHTCQIDDQIAGKLLCVRHISLDKIVSFIYGEKINGESIQYRVTLERNIGGFATNFGIASTSALYCVAAANASEISRLMNKVNTPMNINTPSSAFVKA